MLSSRGVLYVAREAEDAALTGSTRSLVRRLMGLNFKSRMTGRRTLATALTTIKPKVPFKLADRAAA
jgi:hypothetical protein